MQEMALVVTRMAQLGHKCHSMGKKVTIMTRMVNFMPEVVTVSSRKCNHCIRVTIITVLNTIVPTMSTINLGWTTLSQELPLFYLGWPALRKGYQ